MSIFNYLKESLVDEEISLSQAKKYTKIGRKNEKTLPPEIKEIYDEIFGNKNRVNIGQIEVRENTAKRKQMDDTFEKLMQEIEKNLKPEVPRRFRIYKNPGDKDYNYVNVDAPEEIEKTLQQAYDKTKGKYLLKTLVKRLKPYVNPEALNNIAHLSGKYSTFVSDYVKDSMAPIILTKHPYDVAGMTSGRRWAKTSCKNLETGCNRHFIDNEVGHILAAYVANPKIEKNKDILTDPYARLLVLPSQDPDTEEMGLYVSSDLYPKNAGNVVPDFYPTVSKYLKNYGTVFDDSSSIEPISDYYKDFSYPEYSNPRITDREINDWVYRYQIRDVDDSMEIIQNWINDMVRFNDFEDNDSLRSYIEYNLDQLEYTYDNVLSEFKEKYGIDTDSEKNKDTVLRGVIGYSDYTSYEMKELYDDNDWDYMFDSDMSLEEFVEKMLDNIENDSDSYIKIIKQWYDDAYDNLDYTVEEIIESIKQYIEDKDFDVNLDFDELEEELQKISRIKKEEDEDNPQQKLNFENYIHNYLHHIIN